MLKKYFCPSFPKHKILPSTRHMLNRFKTLILISYSSPTTLPQTPVFFLKNTYGSLEVCSHHSLWASSPRGFAARSCVVVGLALLAQIGELAHRLQPSCKLHEKRHILCKSKGSYFWFAEGGSVGDGNRSNWTMHKMYTPTPTLHRDLGGRGWATLLEYSLNRKPATGS